MGFWDDNFGSRHTRRLNKGSIDAADYLVSIKSLNQNFGPLDWRPRPVKFCQKNKNTPLSEPLQANPSPKSKNCFLIEPRSLAACIEVLNNSLAIAASELSPKKHAPIYWLARSLKGLTAGPRYIRGCCLMLKRRYGFRAGA